MRCIIERLPRQIKCHWRVALKQKYGFRAQPYFVLLDGDGVKTWYGLVEADEFRNAFDALVGG
jgi:hypothetical protein